MGLPGARANWLQNSLRPVINTFVEWLNRRCLTQVSRNLAKKAPGLHGESEQEPS